MKRAVSLVMTVILIFSVFYNLALAEDTLKAERMTGGFVPSEIWKSTGIEIEDLPKFVMRSSKSPQKSLYEFIEDKLREKAETITAYPTYKVNYEEFLQTLREVLFNNYDIMAYDEIGRYYCCGDYFVSFTPQYFTPDEGEDAAIMMMQAEIEKYLAAVEDIPKNDIVGKVLVIHDLFCKNNRYAFDEYNEEIDTGIANNAPRTAYYLFKNKRAVCQGNCIALKAIFDALDKRLGGNVIETSACSSNELKHIWNVVKINGQWYYIDETYDDP
ncbi:MAG: hypothetical protein IKR46_01165, partial [Clostridia bacterium]|nr:hypothetical protein [Clostridia bacterium]